MLLIVDQLKNTRACRELAILPPFHGRLLNLPKDLAMKHLPIIISVLLVLLLTGYVLKLKGQLDDQKQTASIGSDTDMTQQILELKEKVIVTQMHGEANAREAIEQRSIAEENVAALQKSEAELLTCKQEADKWHELAVAYENKAMEAQKMAEQQAQMARKNAMLAEQQIKKLEAQLKSKN
jgi:hypothetical protein